MPPAAPTRNDRCDARALSTIALVSMRTPGNWAHAGTARAASGRALKVWIAGSRESVREDHVSSGGKRTGILVSPCTNVLPLTWGIVETSSDEGLRQETTYSVYPAPGSFKPGRRNQHASIKMREEVYLWSERICTGHRRLLRERGDVAIQYSGYSGPAVQVCASYLDVIVRPDLGCFALISSVNHHIEQPPRFPVHPVSYLTLNHRGSSLRSAHLFDVWFNIRLSVLRGASSQMNDNVVIHSQMSVELLQHAQVSSSSASAPSVLFFMSMLTKFR